MCELPVEGRGEINCSKLGWLLKKNANRIVGGFEFQQAEADEPPLPPSPPPPSSVEKTVTGWTGRRFDSGVNGRPGEKLVRPRR